MATIGIFTEGEGDGIESRLSSKIFSTLSFVYKIPANPYFLFFFVKQQFPFFRWNSLEKKVGHYLGLAMWSSSTILG